MQFLKYLIGACLLLHTHTTFCVFPFSSNMILHKRPALSSPCPEYRVLSERDGERIRSCVYTPESRPYYRNSLRNFSFVFDMANALPPRLPVKQHIAAIDIDAYS